MATIDSAKDAERLARAIAADILLYNEDSLIDGFEQGRPLGNLAEQLAEAKALYDSRVSLAVRAQGPLFACVFEQLVERWAIGRRLPVAGIGMAVAAAFGEQPQAIAAFRQGGVAPASRTGAAAPPSRQSSTSPPSRPPGPGPASTPPRAPLAVPTATPLAPPSAARLAARSPWGDGFLVLEPHALCFERADADRAHEREQFPLSELQELRLRRLGDGSWELGLTAGVHSGSWTFSRIEDPVTIARHVLGRVGRPSG